MGIEALKVDIHSWYCDNCGKFGDTMRFEVTKMPKSVRCTNCKYFLFYLSGSISASEEIE